MKLLKNSTVLHKLNNRGLKHMKTFIPTEVEIIFITTQVLTNSDNIIEIEEPLEIIQEQE